MSKTYRNKLYIAMKYMKNEQDAMDAAFRMPI